MELRFSTPFPIFSPNQTSHHPSTEIKFSRWNNANAEPFLRIQRSQKQVEDEIRRERRFESASLISVDGENDVGSSRENPEFKSVGTPSSPSRRSIPGKFSKYSKEPKPKSSHPAFRRVHRVFKPRTEDVSIREDGVSYQIPNAPFAFQYSYTETPKMKPLALREPPFVPFGPTTMPRPWTGRAPLPPSKKKLPEFDSFRLPPPHKKGVKPVQAPGPFLAGSAPKYVYSREEILGEPLSEEEIKAMIQSTMRTTRQLNMGRDGLTHNMLTNIHALWKRRRVCKIKCKGVCTVDMENVRQQLEEKTGGKIIYCRGGVIFLFRGRNYNYKTRPQYPLMLWKPATPVYPRLIKKVPDGLTLEEVTEMRKIGHKLPPICKLGKNGVYIDLVKNVKEAFEECELVSINCQGLNPSDYKKIGAKLKDLVPCILISFERESILMWRGRDWKSSLPSAPDGVAKSIEDGTPTDPNISSDLQFQEGQIIPDVGHDICLNQKVTSSSTHIYGEDVNDDSFFQAKEPLIAATHSNELNTNAINEETPHSTLDLNSSESDKVIEDHEKCKNITESDHIGNNTDSSKSLCTQGVLHLWKQAVESGSALVLDSQSLDANIVFEKAVTHAKTAPSCATFKQSSKASNPKSKGEKSKISELKDDSLATTKSGQEKKVFKNQTKRLDKEDYPVVVPHGSLRVDELAKLLL